MMRPLVLVLTLALLTGSALGSLAFWQALLGGGAAAGSAASASSVSNTYTVNTPAINVGGPRKQISLGVGYK